MNNSATFSTNPNLISSTSNNLQSTTSKKFLHDFGGTYIDHNHVRKSKIF